MLMSRLIVRNIQLRLTIPTLGLVLVASNPAIPSHFDRSDRPTDQEQLSPAEGSKAWVLVRMANGRTESGFVFSQNRYKGPAGQIVNASIIHCGTPEAAKKEFEESVAKASKVVDQTEILDNDKNVTGRRAVLSIDRKGQKTFLTILIMKIVSPNLFDVSSDSMQDAVDFEKVRNRH